MGFCQHYSWKASTNSWGSGWEKFARIACAVNLAYPI